MPRCLRLLRTDPTLVFSISELLSAFMNERVVSEWVQKTLIAQHLMSQLRELIKKLDANLEKELPQTASHFGSLLHLLCLLWQNFDPQCRLPMIQEDFYDHMLKLFFRMTEGLEGANRFVTSLGICCSRMLGFQLVPSGSPLDRSLREGEAHRGTAEVVRR